MNHLFIQLVLLSHPMLIPVTARPNHHQNLPRLLMQRSPNCSPSCLHSLLHPYPPFYWAEQPLRKSGSGQSFPGSKSYNSRSWLTTIPQTSSPTSLLVPSVLVISQRSQPHSSLRAFGLAAPSAWYTSLTSLRFLIKITSSHRQLPRPISIT